MFKCNAFPLLDSYEKALAHFERVKPIMRGSNKGAKPIHLRSHSMEQIVRDGDDVVYAYIWGMPDSTIMRERLDNYIVRWKPNGEIWVRPSHYNCAYDQLSSMFGLNFFRHNNAVWVQTHQTFRLRNAAEGHNVFKRGTTHYLELMNPIRDKRLYLKRKEANNVRSRYGAFRDYLRATLKLREGVFTLSECLEMFGCKHEEKHWWSMDPIRGLDVGATGRFSHNPIQRPSSLPKFMELIGSDDPVKFYRASLMLARVFGERSWYMAGDNERLLSEKVAMQALDRILFAMHKDEVFQERELEYGDTARGAWEWVKNLTLPQ